MAGSSIKNSLHRRNHKERSQLVGRQRLGLLEKHKDYVLRARDYASKKQRIKRLQEKVAERNKDEYYFGMNASKTQGGVAYQSRGNTALDMDTIKLLKSQDANYLRTQLAIERSQMARTKAQLEQLTDLLPSSSHSAAAGMGGDLVEDDDEAELERNLRAAEAETLEAAGLLGELATGQKGKGKESIRPRLNRVRKTVFVDSRVELSSYRPSAAAGPSNAIASSSSVILPASTEVDTLPIDLGWASPPKSTKAKKAAMSSTTTTISASSPSEAELTTRSKRHRLHLLHTLSAHTTRAAHLASAQKELELQKALMGKGGKKKLASLKSAEEDEDEEEEMTEDGPQKRRREGFSGRAFKWAAERKR